MLRLSCISDQPSQAFSLVKHLAPRTLVLAAFILVFLFSSSSAIASSYHSHTESHQDSILGDVNLDGIVNILDIVPFISLISTGSYQYEADLDGNNIVNILDIGPLVELLISDHFVADPRNSKPNVVMIIVDDLGYGDLDDDHMPLTSELFASQGTSMHLYGHQNCIPSRAALLTGMSPVRFNQHGVFAWPENGGVPGNLTLLPEFLKGAGYQTTAIGKWHLGSLNNQTPTAQGFDSFVGLRGGHIHSYGSRPNRAPYPDGTWGHDHHTRHDLAENGTSFYTSQYSTHLFRDRAIEFLESTEGSNEPFFAYISFNAPHSPYHVPRASFDAVKNEHGVTAADEQFMYTFAENVVGLPANTTAPEEVQHRINKAIYYAMVKELDGAVSQIWNALNDSGQADNTMFLFASDNGGVSDLSDNGGFRGGKGSPYEGGHYVANGIIAPWISVGQEISSDIWLADLTPTILELAGVNYTGLGLDGATAVRAMMDNREVVRKTGITSFPCHVDKRFRVGLNQIKASASVHGSNYKYIRFYTFDLDETTIIDIGESLYDLNADPFETRSLHGVRAHAEVLERLRTEHDFWIGDARMKAIKTINLSNPWVGFDYPDEWGDY